MYLTFDEYTELGGSTWSEDDYGQAEWLAEVIMDDVTLNRLQTVDWSDWEGRVKRCMFIILETLPALESAYEADTADGRSVSSFSNGVDSFSFGTTSDETETEAVRAALYRELLGLLPVELCSACVGWNHAG